MRRRPATRVDAGPYMRLKLSTGPEIEAVVHLDPQRPRRSKCLLLHGNPGSIDDWSRLIPLLAPLTDVAAIDLPGFGKSHRGPPAAASAPLTLDELTQHTLAAADALGWHDPFILIGHSHGGGVAQTAAATHPRRIAALALLATLGSPAHTSYRLLALPGAPHVARLARSLFRTPSLRAVARLTLRAVMADICSPEPVTRARLERELDRLAAHPEILVSMVEVTRGAPCDQLRASAGKIRCPTVFLHGAEDALVPVACARSIHEQILSAGGRSAFHVVPDAGHMLLEYQAEVVAEIVVREVIDERIPL